MASEQVCKCAIAVPSWLNGKPICYVCGLSLNDGARAAEPPRIIFTQGQNTAASGTIWLEKERGNPPQEGVMTTATRSGNEITDNSVPATPPTGVTIGTIQSVPDPQGRTMCTADIGKTTCVTVEASSSVGACSTCGRPTILDVPTEITDLRQQIATLQAERDRLREELADSRTNHRDANKRNMESIERYKVAESQLAEARKALKIAEHEVIWLSLAWQPNRSQAEAESKSPAIQAIRAALSQPTNPPAVPSEEEVALKIMRIVFNGANTEQQANCQMAARAVLALMKGEK